MKVLATVVTDETRTVSERQACSRRGASSRNACASWNFADHQAADGRTDHHRKCRTTSTRAAEDWKHLALDRSAGNASRRCLVRTEDDSKTRNVNRRSSPFATRNAGQELACVMSEGLQSPFTDRKKLCESTAGAWRTEK